MDSPLALYTKDGTRIERHAILDLIMSPSPGKLWGNILAHMVARMIYNGNTILTYQDEMLRVLNTNTNYNQREIHTASGYYSDNEHKRVTVPEEEFILVPYRVDAKGKPYTPLTTLKLDLVTDTIRAWRTGSLLGNEAAPRFFLSPAKGSTTSSNWTVKQANELLSTIADATVSRLGRAIALTKPVDIVAPSGTGLRSLDMRAVSQVPEERVCAVLGVGADVVRLGAGLERAKVGATLKESIYQSWRSCIRPMQVNIEHALTNLLAPHFNLPEGSVLRFDNSAVPILAYEKERAKNELSARLLAEYDRGLISAEEYREKLEYNKE